MPNKHTFEKYVDWYVEKDFIFPREKELTTFKKLLRIKNLTQPYDSNAILNSLGKLCYNAILSKNCKYKNAILIMANKLLKTLRPPNGTSKKSMIDIFKLFEAIFKGHKDIVKQLIEAHGRAILKCKIWSGGKAADLFAYEIYDRYSNQKQKDKRQDYHGMLKVVIAANPLIKNLLSGQGADFVNNGPVGFNIIPRIDPITSRILSSEATNKHVEKLNQKPKQKAEQEAYNAFLECAKEKCMISFAHGKKHQLSLSYDGKVFGKGDGTKGQLGLNLKKACTTWQEIKLPDKAKQIVCGNYFSMILLKNGKAKIFGVFYEKKPFNEASIKEHKPSTDKYGYADLPKNVWNLFNPIIKQIAAGENHALALLNNGYVMGYGSNRYIQLRFKWLENENDMFSNTWRYIQFRPACKVKEVACGYGSSLFLLMNGKVMKSHISIPSVAFYRDCILHGTCSYYPKPISIHNVIKIAANSAFHIFIKKDNTIVATKNPCTGDDLLESHDSREKLIKISNQLKGYEIKEINFPDKFRSTPITMLLKRNNGAYSSAEITLNWKTLKGTIKIK